MTTSFRIPKALWAILASASAIPGQTEPAGPIPETRAQVVAVLPFSTIGHDSTAGIILSDAIAMEILRTRKARVLERSQIKSILEEQGLQQSGLCDAQECAIEVGRILGVQRIVVGSVGKLGNTNTMTLRLVDVGSSEILGFASERTEGRLESMLQNAVRHSVESLFPQVATPVPAGPPPVAAASSAQADSVRPAISTPPSAVPFLRAIRPDAIDLSLETLVMGSGTDLYAGAGFGWKARAWWVLPVVQGVSAGGGFWRSWGPDYDGWAGRTATASIGYGAILRSHFLLQEPVDLYCQYEFQHGHVEVLNSTTNADGSISILTMGDYGDRWVTLHTFGGGGRWKTPIPRLDAIGGYSFGLLGHDPLHRAELSLLWNWTPR